MRQKKLSGSRGFSAIEILVALGILVLTGVLIASFQINIFANNTILGGSLTADSEMRSAIKRVVAELRGAAQSDAGSYQLALAGDNTLTFYSDIDGDGRHEQVRYFMTGTTLRRGVLKPTGSPSTYVPANETFSDAVHNIANPGQLIFTYYDENYSGSQAALTLPINLPLVRLIKITLTVDADSAKPPSPLTLTSQVAIRSLKY